VQFHLNGFQPGDPSISEAARERRMHMASTSPLEEVDVLIVGCGPTGLTLAAQLAAFPSIRTRIVEQKSGPLQIGQADGIACRTMEMFEAFGFCERVVREAYWVNETCFWKPDDARPECIVRSGVVQDVEDGLSEFPHVILNQARVHDFYLELMRNAPAPIEPDYSLRLVELNVDEASLSDPSARPLTAQFERSNGGQADKVETVRARYVVGCDGARSAVRRVIGTTLEGDSANQAWGVMDVLAVTDFPDIRRKSAIHSAKEGSILIIPREGGYLVRMYIELDKLAENQRVGNLNVTIDYLIDAARRILHPYSLAVKEVAWWSVYEIGHRLCDRFDDRPVDAGDNRFPRLFIAGDACHTHSPKAGQGMNVSMQDAFNLGWKLAWVLLGRASLRLLDTYSVERQAVARELIDFDHKWSRMFSARPKGSAAPHDGGIDPAEFQDYFVRQGRFTAGTATRYRPSLITGDSAHQDLARGFPVGMRFHSAPVLRVADAKPVQLGHRVRADGRWRLFAFADAAHPTDASSRLRRLCEFLHQSPDSPVRRFCRPEDDIDAVIEVIAICQQAHGALSIEGMPALLLPRKGRYGLVDYEKIYCPDLKGGRDIFDLRQIDRQRGCLVIVRPDQYIAHVLPLDADAELSAFFHRFML
jgi:phenol 2-monooxygenase